MGDIRQENVLVLDYNTIHLQSLGFAEIMIDNGVESAAMHSLNPFDKKLSVVNFFERNTALLFDDTVSEKEYFDYINTNYIPVTEKSPPTHLLSIMATASMQQFSSSIYIARCQPYPINIAVSNRFKPVTFDIFDAELVQKFINENKITSLICHDIRMVHDIVFSFGIDLFKFTFFISKLGYNYDQIDGKLQVKFPQIEEYTEKFGYKVAMVDIADNNQDEPETFTVI